MPFGGIKTFDEWIEEIKPVLADNNIPFQDDQQESLQNMYEHEYTPIQVVNEWLMFTVI